MAQAPEVTRAKIQKRRRPAATQTGPPPPPKAKPTGVFATPATTKSKLQKEVLKGIGKVKPQKHHSPVSLHTIESVVHSVYGGGSGKKGSHAATAQPNPIARPVALSGFGRAAKNIGSATAEHPGQVSVNTLKGLRDQAAAVPGGIVSALTTRPDRTAGSILANMQKRYGETDAQMRKRFIKEGVAPEMTDAFMATGGAGAVVGRGVTAAVRASGSTSKLARAVTGTRPALRTSGGAAKAQKLSPNAFRAVAQRGEDRLRLRKVNKAIQGLDHATDARRAPGHVVEAARANQAAGRTVEVVPLRGASKAQRVGVARLKSRSVLMNKAEQNRRIEQDAQKRVNQLSHAERQAFYHVAAGLVPTTATASVADIVKSLQHRRAVIVATRTAEGVDKVRKNVDELRKIDELLQNPDKHFTPALAQVVRDLHAQDRTVAADNPALHVDQAQIRRHSQQAEHLGLRQGEFIQATPLGMQRIHRPETAQAFADRVAKVAKRKGLERPLYFPSESRSLIHNPDYASRAVGGARAVSAPKQYTGKGFRAGIQDTSPAVYMTGLARSIKLKHNWNLVADTFDQHTFAGLKNMHMGSLLKELDTRGIDPQSVSLWNPGRYRDELRTYNEAAHGNADHHTPDEFGVDHLKTALADGVVEDPRSVPTKFHPTTGWSVVPRDAYNEIMASTRPSGKAGRSWDIFRGKQSRLMLSPNPAWNAFQGLSNVGLGTAAVAAKGGALPVALARQARIYRSLDAPTRELVDAHAGEGSAVHGHQVRMGATLNGKVSNKYRGLKASPVWDKRVAGIGPRVRNLNPFEAGFAVDRWQNAHFRRAVLFQSIKQASGKLDAETVKAVMNDPVKAEGHAQFMNDWMGDYVTLTHRERMGVARGPMFYGFMRHSLNLVFKTLPRDHPLVAGLMMELGNLQRDELKKLGVDTLPWAKGKYYFTKGGKLHEVDLTRANPTLNALTGASGLGQIAGLMGPVVGAAVDQLAHSSLFKDKGWQVYGTPAPYGAKASYFGPARPRILGEDLLGMIPGYRAAEKMTMFGPQGDDSMLFSQRPILHKDKKLRAADRTRQAQDQADANLPRILMPLIPKVSRDPEIAKTYGITPKKKPKKKSNYFPGGGLDGGIGGSLGGGGLQ